MGKRKYSHEEGVHRGLSLDDWHHWPLSRYVMCLDNETMLNKCIKVAHEEAKRRDASTPDGEKWTLRFHGLEILRDVDNEQDTE